MNTIIILLCLILVFFIILTLCNRINNLTAYPKNTENFNNVYPNKMIKSKKIYDSKENPIIKEHQKQIGVEYMNKICWLSQYPDVISQKYREKYYSNSIHPLKLNCNSNNGDTFNIDKVGSNYNINKIIDGKKCNLIFTPEGDSLGFSKYNAALSCNNEDTAFSDMKLVDFGDYYKIHPTKRNRCYLRGEKYIDYDIGAKYVIPIFLCFSTKIAAPQKGKIVVFK